MSRYSLRLFQALAIVLFLALIPIEISIAQNVPRAVNFTLTPETTYVVTKPDGTTPNLLSFRITNTGTESNQYFINFTMDSNITLDAPGLYSSPWPSTPLGPSQSTVITFTVRAMPNAENKTHGITVRVNSTGTSVVRTTTLYLIVELAPGVEVQAPPVQKGINSEELCFYFNVTNKGNGLDSFNLKARSTMEAWGWTVRIESSGAVYFLANVPRGAKQIVRVYLKIPEDASMQHPSCTIYLTANSSHDTSIMDEKSTSALLLQTHIIAVEATSELEKSVMPDQSVVFSMNVINMGNGQEDVSLSYQWVDQPPGWPLPQISPSTLKLNLDYKGTQNGIRGASIEVKVPKASPRANYEIQFIATSLANSSVSRSITFKICVAAYYGVNMSIPEEARRVSGTVGGTVEFAINVSNEGNGADMILFGVEDLPQGWSHEILLGSSAVTGVSLSYLETRQIKLVVHISDNLSLARIGTYSFNFTITSQGNSSKIVRNVFVVDVVQKHGLEFKVESNFSVVNPFAGYAKAVFKMLIKNTGNGPDDYDLVLAPGISKSWGSIPMMQAHVQPDDTQQVLLTISVPTNAEKGDYVITVYAICAGDPLINQSISVTVRVVKCDLAVQPAIVGIDDTIEQQVSVQHGKQLTLWINVKNTGEETLNNVTVLFLDGDVPIGYSNISTISPDQEVKASITWLATGYTNHRISAVVDPFGVFPEMIETDNNAKVEILVLEEQEDNNGKKEETPWLAIISVIILICAVAAVALFVVIRAKKAEKNKKVDEDLYASIYGKTPDGRVVENVKRTQQPQQEVYSSPVVDVNSEEYRRIYGTTQQTYAPYPTYSQTQANIQSYQQPSQQGQSYSYGYNTQQPNAYGQYQSYDSYPTYSPQQTQNYPNYMQGDAPRQGPRIVK